MTEDPRASEQWVAQSRKLLEACSVKTGNMTDREIVDRADQIGGAVGEFGATVGDATARAVGEMTPTFRALAATFRGAGSEALRQLREATASRVEQPDPEAIDASDADEPDPPKAA